MHILGPSSMLSGNWKTVVTILGTKLIMKFVQVLVLSHQGLGQMTGKKSLPFIRKHFLRVFGAF